MKNLFYLLFGILLFTSCNDKCEDISCTPPPPQVYLNLVDEETGENIFTSERFEQNDLTLTENGNNYFDFSFYNNNLLIVGIGFGEKNYDFNFQLEGQEPFQVLINTYVSYGECCSSTQVESFNIEGVDFEYNQESYIYTIFIP